MAALALKAIGYGAEKIPDRAFEKIPGGFFTPAERKKIKKNRDDDRRRSEQRHSDHRRRRSHRDRTPPTDYSDHSGYDDTDYEREYRKKQSRRRAKSLGRSYSRSRSRSRSLSRGRRQERMGTDLDGEMDRAERGPEFPPPPGSEYRPYNPQDYIPATATTGASVTNQNYDQYDHRGSSSVGPEYGYTPQPQPMNTRASVSSSAARYTPAAAYAQAPVTTVAAPTTAYPPYNPADYASPSPTTRAPTGHRPTPPPFYRQESRSQPSLPQYPYPNDHLAYLEPPSRHGSTSSSHHRRHGDRKHHRTRSAGHHGRSSSRVTDRLRDRFENLDLQEKNLAASVGGALAGGLAGNAIGKGTLSTIVGAAIGGLGGRELEKRHEKKRSTRESSLATQSREKSPNRHSSGRRGYSMSPSRDKRRSDRYEASSDSDSDSDGHHRAARRRRGSRSRHDDDH